MPPLEDFYKNKNNYQKNLKRTQASKKFFNYIEQLKYKEEFIKELRWFRKHIVHQETNQIIPKEGLPLPKSKKEYMENFRKYDYIYDDKKQDYYHIENYNKREEKFIKKYQLNIFGDVFYFLLFYNSIEPMKKYGYFSGLEIIDLNSFLIIDNKKIGFQNKTDNDSIVRILKQYAKSTPIAILIHPYMTENDIINSVRSVYKTGLIPLMEHYDKNINLKKVRGRSNILQERNIFIYENKDLPIKQLTTLVNKKYKKNYEYTYIQSILKKQKKISNIN